MERTMNSNQLREEQAFEGLFVQTLRKVEGENLDIDAIRCPTEKEKSALRRVGADFINRLVDGESVSFEEKEDEGLALSCGGVGGALFRTEDVDDELADELDKADQEIIERKKREQQDGETS